MAVEISSRLWLILMMARLIRTKATTKTISPMSAALYMPTPNSNTQGDVPVTFPPFPPFERVDYCTLELRRGSSRDYRIVWRQCSRVKAPEIQTDPLPQNDT